MGKIEDYAANQLFAYEKSSVTLEQAKAVVAPNYDEMERKAGSYVKLVMANYFLRRFGRHSYDSDELKNLKALDFGCGVGRLMKAFKQAGLGVVDGADLSSEMLKHVSQAEELAGSKTFLTSGYDAGNAPINFYDVAYSFLCLQHIPMRQTRLLILSALNDKLNDEGIICIEFKIFPGIRDSKIPSQHASWQENRVSKYTNSLSDVWVTAESLGQVYDDFRLYFHDVQFLEIDNHANYYQRSEGIYPYGFNDLLVFASKRKRLKDRLFSCE